jgi:hypothetical protein
MNKTKEQINILYLQHQGINYLRTKYLKCEVKTYHLHTKLESICENDIVKIYDNKVIQS